MGIFDIAVMVIVIIFLHQAGRCVPGFLKLLLSVKSVCVFVCVHACVYLSVYVPAPRLLITSGMI